MEKRKINKIKVLFIFIIIIVILCFAKLVNYNKQYKENIEKLEKEIINLEEKINKLDEKNAGITVTMIGGSNMKEYGNIYSCGFIVRTKNEDLIIVDGGREKDAKIVLEYIKQFGNGTIDYWFITHAHEDHIGALLKLLEEENITIKNLCYSLNSLEWYREYDKRGFEIEEKMIKELENPKIKNKIECKKDQVIKIDNIDCEILRIANPEIIHSDNGNDSSMVFKLIATDVDKSILFLGDAYVYTSLELLENPEKLKSDAVQMAHHGQNGVSKEVYEAIDPELCFFNSPEWLYNNDSGAGYNTGNWQSIIVRGWMQEMDTKNIVAYNGDRTIRFT